MIRSYSELVMIPEFENRYEYLREFAEVGASTFGFERWLNQRFYTSVEWRQIRQQVIARDRGCDMGVAGREISRDLIVHHMNPITVPDITHHNGDILNQEYLITVSLRTHNAIHFGSAEQLEKPWAARYAGDTKMW